MNELAEVIGPSMPSREELAELRQQQAVIASHEDEDDFGPLLPSQAQPLTEEDIARRKLERKQEWDRVRNDTSQDGTKAPVS